MPFKKTTLRSCDYRTRRTRGRGPWTTNVGALLILCNTSNSVPVLCAFLFTFVHMAREALRLVRLQLELEEELRSTAGVNGVDFDTGGFETMHSLRSPTTKTLLEISDNRRKAHSFAALLDIALTEQGQLHQLADDAEAFRAEPQDVRSAPAVARDRQRCGAIDDADGPRDTHDTSLFSDVYFSYPRDAAGTMVCGAASSAILEAARREPHNDENAGVAPSSSLSHLLSQQAAQLEALKESHARYATGMHAAVRLRSAMLDDLSQLLQASP